MREKLGGLKYYCTQSGRSYDEIERSVLAAIRTAPKATSLSEIMELCKNLASTEVRHFIFNMPNADEIEILET